MLYRRPSVYIIFLVNLLVNAGLVRFFEEAVSLIVITAGVIISTPLIKTGTQKATKKNNQTNNQTIQNERSYTAFSLKRITCLGRYPRSYRWN